MDSYRMVGYTSYCMNERIAACDHATTCLEELTESLTQRQEEECQLDISDEKFNDDFSVLKVMEMTRAN